MITGENGLIKRVKETTDKASQANRIEELQLLAMNYLFEKK